MMNPIKRTIVKLRERLSPRGLILMYHRVANPELDPWGLSVSPAHFAEQLQVIKRYFYPLSLQELMKRHQAGRVPNRAIVVTFDDGYADNLYAAKPLLERHEVPATVFLITGALGEERNFWWDELEWALLHPRILPARLELKTNGACQEWQPGNAAQYSMENQREDRNRRPWDALPGTRLAFFYSVWQHLIQLSKPERTEALNQICTWANIATDSNRENRVLSMKEVNELGQGGLVELGAHTITHPSLALLSTDQQLEEIQGSKTQAEKIIGRPVTSFSYPHGDYSMETPALIQEAGFQSACTTKFECTYPSSDPFQLPRFQVEDWDRKEFLKRLSRWYLFS